MITFIDYDPVEIHASHYIIIIIVDRINRTVISVQWIIIASCSTAVHAHALCGVVTLRFCWIYVCLLCALSFCFFYIV